MSTATHKAAAIVTVGQPLSIIDRNTPEPGPNEVLIQVQALAVNPVDYYQRDHGFPPMPSLPYVAGEDVSGIIIKSNAPNGLLPPGTRVLAFASSFYRKGTLDYGAFQERVIARYEGVVELPEKLSFEEGAVMPLAVLTALSAYTTVGLKVDTKFTPTDHEAILIWGASSSVGTFAVQSAKLMGYTVYATAGAHNLEYIKELGAHAAYDYKDPDVVQKIVHQAQADGVTLRTAHVVTDKSLQQTLDVLKLTKGDGAARIAHSPVLPEDHPTLENTEIKFVQPPAPDEARHSHIHDCFRGWLKNGLHSGEIVPSPRIHTIPGGLQGVNEALDTLRSGVSAVKVVAKF